MRYTEIVGKRASAAVLFLSAMACSGGNSLPTGHSPVTAEVEFRYELSESEASSKEAASACAGPVRLHPSFWGYAQVTLRPMESGGFTARFEEVPVGRHSLRLAVPEACAGGSLYANGALISRGGSAASFEISTDGRITP